MCRCRPPRPPPVASVRSRRWRWVGAFSAEADAGRRARARSSGARSWWAGVGDGQRLHERSAAAPRPRAATPGRAQVGLIDLRFPEAEGIEVVSPHGAEYIWTRKQGGIPMRRTVLGKPFEGHGFIDDTVGRTTCAAPPWRWSAGVGSPSRRARGVGLVDGVHDDPEASERTVWVDGTPHHVGPLPFAGDLSGVGDLRCETVAVRARRERMLVFASDYEQPFGALHRLAADRRDSSRGLGRIRTP